MRISKFGLSLFFLVCLVSSSAKADWTADLKATSSKGDFSEVRGKFYAQRDHFRLDSSQPFELAAYAKVGSRRVEVAVHSFKIRLSSSLEKFTGQIPPCLAKEFSACVKDLNLKKLESEKCGTKICDVYEGTGSPFGKGVKRVKLWHLSGEKEAILAKAVITKTNGSTITTTFSNITRKSFPESFYRIPGNYKDAGALEDFFSDLRGGSE